MAMVCSCNSSTRLALWGHSNKSPPLEYDVIPFRGVPRVVNRVFFRGDVLFSWITLKKV